MQKNWKFLVFGLVAIVIFIYFAITSRVDAAEMTIYFYVPDNWNSDIAYINY